MSKSGRYSADRKKIEAVSAAKTIEVHDCGTIFSVTETCALTLPTVAKAGKGWWCKVVCVDASKTVTVNVNSQTTIGLELSNTAAAITGNVAITGTAGAMVEVMCDGSRYIILGAGVAAGNLS
tara:strand:+ start:45 stop:413 length:369 start_codon:yes stop_codon:yes gene_type:complete